MSVLSDPRLEPFLREQLLVARRRTRWWTGLGAALALLVGVCASLLGDAVRDPEGVVEMLPLHTGRTLQAGLVHSLESGAPSTARMAQRQMDRVPSEINAAVKRELEGWIERQVTRALDRAPDQLRALGEEQPDALAQALGLGAPSAGADSGKAERLRLRGYLRTELRPVLEQEVDPLEVGSIAYLVATANAIEELGDDAPSAEQLLEHLVLGLLTHLIAPA